MLLALKHLHTTMMDSMLLTMSEGGLLNGVACLQCKDIAMSHAPEVASQDDSQSPMGPPWTHIPGS